MFRAQILHAAPVKNAWQHYSTPKTAHFVPQNSLFWPKTAPEPGQTKGNGLYTPLARTVAPCDKEPFAPLQLCHMSEKKPKNGQKWPKLRATFVTAPQNQERAVSWATWLKSEI